MFLIMAMVLNTLLYGQNLKADLQKMVDRLEKAKGLALSYHITTYDQLDKDRLTFEQKGYVNKYGNQSVAKVNDVTSLRTNKLFLMVDDKLKMIQLVELNDKDENVLMDLLKTESLKSTASNSKVTYKGIVGGKKHYLLTELGQMKEAHIYIDQKTGFISRLIYYYDTKRFPSANKVIINYTADFGYKPTPGTFSASKYVEKKKEKFIPVKKYSTYQLIVDDHEN